MAAAACALTRIAVAVVCLLVVLGDVGQPAAAFTPTPCGDCLKDCGIVCQRYGELFCNEVCYQATQRQDCDASCQRTACQNCQNTAFPACGATCANGCRGGALCPGS